MLAGENLDVGVALPGGGVVGETVQKVEHLPLLQRLTPARQVARDDQIDGQIDPHFFRNMIHMK